MIPESNDTTKNLEEAVSSILLRWKYILATGILLITRKGSRKSLVELFSPGQAWLHPKVHAKSQFKDWTDLSLWTSLVQGVA